MAYRKVYFRIRTDCYSSGWTSDADRTAFKEESRRLFQELGWAVTFGHNGSCDTAAKDKRNKIGNQFVAELMDQLLQKGWLVSAKTSHGDGIRTATNKERGISRQPAAQVDGQITMEDQENKAPKKKKGGKTDGSQQHPDDGLPDPGNPLPADQNAPGA